MDIFDLYLDFIRSAVEKVDLVAKVVPNILKKIYNNGVLSISFKI